MEPREYMLWVRERTCSRLIQRSGQLVWVYSINRRSAADLGKVAWRIQGVLWLCWSDMFDGRGERRGCGGSLCAGWSRTRGADWYMSLGQRSLTSRGRGPETEGLGNRRGSGGVSHSVLLDDDGCHSHASWAIGICASVGKGFERLHVL